MYNKTLRVLFEKKTNNNELKGYSSNYVRVKTTYKKQLVNNFSIVKIVEVGKNICSSKIVEWFITLYSLIYFLENLRWK